MRIKVGVKYRGFSLVEVMVMLLLSSIVFLVVYNLISIGIRFFETFSSVSDFSVTQLVRDIEYELNYCEQFEVTGRVIELRGRRGVVRYIFGLPSKNFTHLKVRKEVVSPGNRERKEFLLRGVVEVEIRKEMRGFREKIFICVFDAKGDRLFEGYLP